MGYKCGGGRGKRRPRGEDILFLWENLELWKLAREKVCFCGDVSLSPQVCEHTRPTVSEEEGCVSRGPGRKQKTQSKWVTSAHLKFRGCVQRYGQAVEKQWCDAASSEWPVARQPLGEPCPFPAAPSMRSCWYFGHQP